MSTPDEEREHARCSCPRLRDEDAECHCDIGCATCWPWAHEPADDNEGGVVLMTEDALMAALAGTLAPDYRAGQGLGPCGGCGHDPACGFASVSKGDVEVWLCHADDHSCYVGLS